MWGWVRPLLEAIIAWLERTATKPRTLEDANTPEDIRARWAAYLRERLPDEDDRTRRK